MTKEKVNRMLKNRSCRLRFSFEEVQMATFSLHIVAAIRGYHVYKESW